MIVYRPNFTIKEKKCENHDKFSPTILALINTLFTCPVPLSQKDSPLSAKLNSLKIL